MLHLLFVSLTLFYVTNGFNGRCANMTTTHKPECARLLAEEYNYTVPELSRMRYLHAKILEERLECKLEGVCPTVKKSIIGAPTPCSGGSAGEYSCNNVDLLAFVPLSGEGGLGSSNNADGNDIWGYTDQAGNQFAITGQTDGASIVDITNPSEPEVLCFIPAKVSTNTLWRDIKLAENNDGVKFAFIVADRGGQGLQWVPLDVTIAKCRASQTKPMRLTEGEDFGWVGSPVFSGSTNTHNIVGNYEEDKVYLVGSGSCSGGLIKVDTSAVRPGSYETIATRPTLDGCYPNDGYSHDAECVTYSGPDTRFTGREICWGYNENSITVVDYSGPTAQLLSRLTYTTSRYTHQGWVNPSAVEGIQAQRFALMNDELDESGGTVSSQTTYVVDYLSLTDPVLVPWASGISSIDHNLYIRGNYAYEANYRAGLRILSMTNVNSNIPGAKLSETGFFKTWTGALANSFNGAWSVYPYYGNGVNPTVVAVQDIEQGLFILGVSNAVDN
mmetsp:Transcript_71909/g.64610  ORF Transcript_71909/g.64610 Transcript_71909/m.64610 type:complete len:501 (-) Transcript_71909:341-1843(-)